MKSHEFANVLLEFPNEVMGVVIDDQWFEIEGFDLVPPNMNRQGTILVYVKEQDVFQ